MLILTSFYAFENRWLFLPPPPPPPLDKSDDFFFLSACSAGKCGPFFFWGGGGACQLKMLVPPTKTQGPPPPPCPLTGKIIAMPTDYTPRRKQIWECWYYYRENGGEDGGVWRIFWVLILYSSTGTSFIWKVQSTPLLSTKLATFHGYIAMQYAQLNDNNN